MIITTGIASLLLIIIIQSIAFAYYMGKLRTDVNVLQDRFKIEVDSTNIKFKDMDSLKNDINEIKIQLAELRKDLQFLLIPKTRKRTEI